MSSAQTPSASPIDNGVAIALRLVRHQTRMKAAENDGYATPAVFAGNLVSATGGVGFDRNRHRIGRLVVRHRLHSVVEKPKRHILRCQAGERRNRQRFHLPRADIRLADAVSDRRLDQRQPHTVLFSAATNGSAGASGRAMSKGQSQL